MPSAPAAHIAVVGSTSRGRSPSPSPPSPGGWHLTPCTSQGWPGVPHSLGHATYAPSQIELLKGWFSRLKSGKSMLNFKKFE